VPSLVRRLRSRLDVVPITGDRVASEPLPLTPSRRTLQRQKRWRRPVGPGVGFLRRHTDVPICKLNNLALTLSPIIIIIIIIIILCCY
jgi:hypothetical protein